MLVGNMCAHAVSWCVLVYWGLSTIDMHGQSVFVCGVCVCVCVCVHVNEWTTNSNVLQTLKAGNVLYIVHTHCMKSKCRHNGLLKTAQLYILRPTNPISSTLRFKHGIRQHRLNINYNTMETWTYIVLYVSYMYMQMAHFCTHTHTHTHTLCRTQVYL